MATAFLNAPMPQGEEESIYVKPPALLEQFNLIKSNIYWKLHKAVYGLRASPRLWGKERDLQLKNMRFDIKGIKFLASQSSYIHLQKVYDSLIMVSVSILGLPALTDYENSRWFWRYGIIHSSVF